MQAEYAQALEGAIAPLVATSGITSAVGAMTGAHLTRDNPELSFLAVGVGTALPLIALIKIMQFWIRGIKHG
ncbi:hypothetical protein QPK87_25225 [Kamptonema cortianum]|nr:hypothetical protein [Desertifilum sp.]MDK3159837.1 hypothetical protein [Kamptonema cortianum]